MLLDFKLDGKTVIVVGAGTQAYRKTQSFVDSGATIWVISKEFSDGIEQLAEAKKVATLKTEIKNVQAFVGSLNPKPDVFLAVTDNTALNAELVKAAKAVGSLVYSVDNPALSDFILPSVAKVGDVKIAVSTSGKSPAMAKALRERIEEMVKPEDLLEIQLQSELRAVLRRQVADSEMRTKLLYEVLGDSEIKQVLKRGNLLLAKELALKLIEKKGRRRK